MAKGYNNPSRHMQQQGPPIMSVPDLGAGGPSGEDIKSLIAQQQEAMDVSLRMGIVQQFGQLDHHRMVPGELVRRARVIEHYVRTGEVLVTDGNEPEPTPSPEDVEHYGGVEYETVYKEPDDYGPPDPAA